MKRILPFVFLLFFMAKTSLANNVGSEKAAEFVKSLSEEQKQQCVFPFKNINRYDWHFLPATMAYRFGVGIKDLDEVQKQAFYALLRAFLSDEGFTRTQDIMSYEYLLKEMEPNNPSRIPENYYVAIYGTPGTDAVWGWKFSGHHLALNFTVVNDTLAFAPFFFGANPAEVKQGPNKGRRLLKLEEDLGFELLQSFTPIQQEIAIFRDEAYSEIVTTNSQVVGRLKPVGLSAKEMTLEQKLMLNKIVAAYLNSMPADVAKARTARIVKEDMDDIWFGWAGDTVLGKPHYYRIQGKTFLVELDNTQNNANHIHSVWRDFDGDFGEDLLQEHYHESHHAKH